MLGRTERLGAIEANSDGSSLIVGISEGDPVGRMVELGGLEGA